MQVQITNQASALLATTIDTSATDFAVEAGAGAKFPIIAGGTNEWFPVVVTDSGGNTEIMRATARSGDVITVTRGQEGTIAHSFAAGARVEMRLTAGALTEEFAALEAGIGGISTHAVSGGTLDLSATTFAEQIQKFTGPLTSDLTVIIPNQAKRFLAINATTGNFFLVMKTPSGSAICIPQDTEKNVTCDGADVLYRADRHDVGKIEPFAGTAAPPGTFLCDGSAKGRLLTPDLFGKIGTAYGAPSGSTYTLPDYVTGNRFLRAAGGSIPVGTVQNQDIAAHGHTASATLSASSSSMTPTGTVAVSTPTGTVSTTINGQSAGTVIQNNTGPFVTTAGGANWNVATLSATSTFTGNAQTATFTGNSVTPTISGSVSVTVADSTGTETRPNNGAVLFCIRY